MQKEQLALLLLHRGTYRNFKKNLVVPHTHRSGYVVLFCTGWLSFAGFLSCGFCLAGRAAFGGVTGLDLGVSGVMN
jgi:hypothetical protein